MPLGPIPLLTDLMDFLYPRSCPACETAFEDSSEPRESELCDDCLAALHLIEGELCPRCGAPVGPHLSSDTVCRYCRGDRFAFSGVAPLGIYDGLLREACIRGKTSGHRGLTLALTRRLFTLRREWFRAREFDLIVPVPQHWRTRLSRDQNSSECLAEELSTLMGRPLGRNVLSKVRFTPKQAKLSATERRRNLRDAFRVTRRSVVRNKRILLVDDVLTTGSTADACAKALKHAGCGEIFVTVLARGLG